MLTGNFRWIATRSNVMSRNPQSRRIFAALGVSCAINVVWFTLDALAGPTTYHPSRLSKIAGALGYPGGTIADWLAPRGHDAAYFIGGALIAVASSLLFYAVLAWVILTILAWLPSRAGCRPRT